MLRTLLTIGVFLALPMLFLYPLWAQPTCAGEDDLVAYYPMRAMVARELLAGRWPAWNRFEAAGVPMFADPQYAVLHPSTLLFVALSDNLAYSLSVFLAFSLAGGGVWLYLRRVGLAAPAAWFGAIAFMFCGFMVGHRVHLGIIQAAAMLPWGLWALEGLRRLPIVDCQLPIDGARMRHAQLAIGNRQSAIRCFLWLVPIFLLTLSAGHWPTAIHMAVIWAVYFLFRCVKGTGTLFRKRREKASQSPLRGLLAVGAAGLVAAAVFAPQIAATASWLGQSTRAGLPYIVVGENSFFPLAGVMAVFPFLMGNRVPNFFAQPWWGPWHQCEMLGYVGLVTLPLAIGAIWTLFGRRKSMRLGGTDKPVFGLSVGETPRTSKQRLSVPPETDDLRSLVRTWTFILIGAGIWMLGYYLPTYRLIYAIPIIGNVRCPARMVLAVDLALAVLAAVAVHVIAQARANSGFRIPDSGDAASGASNLFSRRRHGDEAVGVESAIGNWQLAISVRLSRVLFRLAAFALPVAMFLFLALTHAFALAAKHWTWFGDLVQPLWHQLLVGDADDLLAATRFSNPAVYVPAIVAFLTVGFLWFVIPTRRRAKWLLLPFAAPVALVVGPFWYVFRRPGGRAWMLVWLILLDLSILARFVDVPAEPDPTRNPELSPVARWLAENGPKEPYRVLAIGGDYHGRAGELLLPKVNGLHNVESISYYGPLGPRDHAWLFGFRPWGENYQLEYLLRTNHLLSLYNVRYVIVEDCPALNHASPAALTPPAGFETSLSIVRDVRILQAPAESETRETVRRKHGDSLLGTSWNLNHGRLDGGIIRLHAPSAMKQAEAYLPVREDALTLLGPVITDHGGIAMGPDLELSIQLRARDGAGGPVILCVPGTLDARLRIDAEQLSNHWREFRIRDNLFLAGDLRLGIQITTQSTKPIEIRNVRLVISTPWEPTVFPNSPRLDREFVNNDRVYVNRTWGGLRSLRPGDPDVYIYENMLCLPRRFPVEEVVWLPDNVSVIDELRYHADKYDLTRQVLMAGPPRDIQVKEFVSENPAAPGLGPHLPANGLGSVILADGSAAAAAGGAEQRAGTVPAWSLAVSAVGILLYLGLGLLFRPSA